MRIKRFRLIIQKLFTNRSIATNNSGLLDEALEHILKLQFGFNLKYDENHHKGDIVNMFLGPVFKDLKKDRTARKSPRGVFEEYAKNFKKKNFIRTASNDFIKYGLTRKITEDEVEEALKTLRELMHEKSTLESIREDLKSKFKNYED